MKTFIGAESLIVKNKPIILFEQIKNEFNNNSSYVYDYLKKQDYYFYELHKSFYLGENVFLRFLLLLLRSLLERKIFLKNVKISIDIIKEITYFGNLLFKHFKNAFLSKFKFYLSNINSK